MKSVKTRSKNCRHNRVMQALAGGEIVAVSPDARMATTVNLDLPGTSCAKLPCVVMCPVWSRQAGKLL